MAIPETFTWIGNQAITSPEAAKRRRGVADALLKANDTPKNWTEGLASVLAGFSADKINNDVAAAESEGAASAAAALASLGPNAGFNDISAALSNPWITQPQASVAAALLQQNLERQDPMYQLQLETAQAELDALLNPGMETPEYFGSTLPYEDAEGNLGYVQLSKGGLPDLPEGARWLEPTSTVNTGTAQTVVGRNTGQVQGAIPIDVAGAAAQEVTGKGNAEAALAAPSNIAQADTALDYIEQIESHPEKPWATGFSAGVGGNAIPGTGRFGFQNLVEQAKSGAFLTAIDSMRGLGALSNMEGQAATQAITRINTALSEADFDKALADYKAIVERGRDRAMRRVRVMEDGSEVPADSVAAGEAAPAASPRVRVFNPATGRLE